MTGRTFAIGDIHGCDRALECVLEQIQPDIEDRIVLLGDIIDRGPNSARCVQMLLNLYNRCQLTLVAGNHEEMLFEALETGLKGSRWLMYGGDVVLANYGGSVDKIPPMHLQYLASGLDYFETESEIFVHANVDPELDLPEQDVSGALYTGGGFPLDINMAPGEELVISTSLSVNSYGFPWMIEEWAKYQTVVPHIGRYKRDWFSLYFGGTMTTWVNASSSSGISCTGNEEFADSRSDVLPVDWPY